MKESAIFQNLKEIAEKLNLKVCSANLRKYSYGIKSGLCRVEGEYRIIIDKHLQLSEKVDVLIEALQKFDIDTGSIDPDIKRLIEKRGGAEREDFFKSENN
jgi:hypothetical protein